MKKSIVQMMMLLALFVVMISCTSTRLNNPVAVEIDGQITAIISCKSRSNDYCGSLSVVAKLSNETVPYSNEVILNKAFGPNQASFRTFAASRIDSNHLVVTALGKETQYIFVLSIHSAQLSIINVLQPISAKNVVSVDISSIDASQFYVVADLTNKRKIARISNSTFQAHLLGSRNNGKDSTSITGNANGAFITEAGDCVNEKNYYVGFAQDASISQCIYQKLSVCSDSGRQSLAYINDQNAVLGIVSQDNVLTYKLSVPVVGTKFVNDKRSVPTPSTREWDTAASSLSCTEGTLMTSSNVIDLANKISDVDLTFDSSSNELVVSFSQQTSATTCSLEGYFYSVNPTTIAVTRVVDSNNQGLNLPSVPCAELGFDRVLFDNDFVLLRYDTTKINLQSVFPGQSL